MKIGIFTQPLHTNFGGILQAYALQTVLERMGNKVYVIYLSREEIPHFSWRKKILCYTKRFLLRYILRKKTFPIFYEENERKVLPIIRQNTNRFIKQHINYYLINSLEELGDEKIFDAYVVGSDQVWRPIYSPWDIEDSFLRFDTRSDIIRIAYAASFGVDTWDFTTEQTGNCRKLAKRFDAISVRENSGVELCKKYLGVDAKWVLDPTMLLDVDDYQKLIEEANVPISKGNLLVYILDRDKKKDDIIKRIAIERNLAPFKVNSYYEDYLAPLKERIQPMVESWLRGFMDAEYVVTDSYHGCVFSILFHRPFIVFVNEGRGMARVSSLLEMFKLDDRLIQLPCASIGYKRPIDWDAIDNILEENKQNSISMLNKHLK